MSRSVAVLSSIGGALILSGAFGVALWENGVYLAPSNAIVYGLVAAAGFGLMFAAAARHRNLIYLDVMVSGILLLVVVSALMKLPGRSPVDETMASMGDLGKALDDYASDHYAFPVARNFDELQRQLVPTYRKTLPREDAWRNEFRFESSREKYVIGSGGRDRRFEKASLGQYAHATTTDLDCDIIYSNGAFVVYYERRVASVPGRTVAPRLDEPTRLDRCEQQVRTHPDDALANARSALCLAQLGLYEKAIPYAKKAIALDPADYQSRSNLGLLYEKLDRPEEGVEWEREAAKIRPNDPEVLNNLGWVLMRAGHNSEAVSVFEKVVRLAPNEATYRSNLREARENAARIPPP